MQTIYSDPSFSDRSISDPSGALGLADRRDGVLGEGQAVSLPETVNLERSRVFDLAATAYEIARSLDGLGLDIQRSVLEAMVGELESYLVAGSKDAGTPG